MIVEIDDLADPRLADFAHRTDVDLRRGAGPALYLAESLLVLERALRAGHTPRAVLSLPASLPQVEELVGPDVPVFSGPGELLAGLTGYVLHRGVVASMERPTLAAPAELLVDARRVVVIDAVVDPTNVGAIFRSVAGIGADAVLVTPTCADPLYRRAIRVSMGTVLQVPWTRAPGWPELAAVLHAGGFQIAALALTPQAVALREFSAPERVALVLGTEGEGLGPDALGAADVHVQIPMRHGIDSLNVAAAAAVAMWAMTE